LPPDQDRDFTQDLNSTTLLVAPDRCLVQAPIGFRGRGGAASLGVLITLADLAASDPVLVAWAPDWAATQNISLYGAAWLTKGPILMDCRLIRVGKKTAAVSLAVYDGQGEVDLERFGPALDAGQQDLVLAASGLATFVRLPRTAASDVDDYNPRRWLNRPCHRHGKHDDRSMYQRMEMIDRGGGRLEQPRTPYVSNAIGTVLGGVQAVLSQAAAESLRAGRAATDIQMHFLDQVKAGPVSTETAVLRETPEHAVVHVRLVDAGNHDKLLTLATVTLRANPP
jgi:acyl-coenzyme A thioesterase PaaI-like protein